MHQSDHFVTWQAQFAAERVKLLEALGELTAGGVIEQVQHIGATSVPGLWVSPCVDVGLSIWPFPLLAQQQEALRELGYELIAGEENAGEQRFAHSSGASQLFVAEAGSDRWTNYLLLRDYLRDTDSVRQSLSAQKPAHATDSTTYAQWKTQILPQLVEAAQTWWINRQSFEAVETVTAELKEYTGFWAVSSGWALDLLLGRVTRVHRDVDVIVPRADQLALQQYLAARDWKWVTPFAGHMEPWPPYMTLELPRHQIHAHRDETFIDFLLSEIENGIWRYRRNPGIIRSTDRAYLSTSAGIPFLAPELVLLYKSKNTSGQERPQDQADFDNIQAHLEPERRAWLRWALLATEPTHPWLERLA